MKKQVIKSAKHRNSDSPLYTLVLDLADWDELDDNGKLDILHEMAVNFTCRTGKWVAGEKPSKLQAAFIGRHDIGLLEVAAYLATVGEREGGKPSKADNADAAQMHPVVDAEVRKVPGAEEFGSPGYLIAYANKLRASHAKVAAKYAGGFTWEWQEFEREAGEKGLDHAKRTCLTNLAYLRRGERLAFERSQKKPSSDLL